MIVTKEVIVTIVGVKKGVPGEFTGTATAHESLVGRGPNGERFEKHWDRWPEAQLNDFVDQWSRREDGDPKFPFWTPFEAVHVYNGSRRRGSTVTRIVGPDGAEMKPAGDIAYCARHDRYQHIGTECFWCMTGSEKDSSVHMAP